MSAKSHNGKVKVGNVSANATIKSDNGDVYAISCDRAATIKTHNGKRYINGVPSETRRKNRNRTTNIHIGSNYSYSNPFDMSNLSNFFLLESRLI